MYNVRFSIVAFSANNNSDVELFRWTRDAESGIARAKAEAVKFEMADDLSNYRAVPVLNSGMNR